MGLYHRGMIAGFILSSCLSTLLLSSPLAYANRFEPELGRFEESSTKLTPLFSLEDPASPSTRLSLPASPDKVLRGEVREDREFKPDVEFAPPEVLPKGEKLVLTVLDFMASGYSWSGDEFHARVKTPVIRNGKVLVPRGALVKGHVESTADAGKFLSKRGKLSLVFDYLLMPDGRKIAFKSDYTKGDNAVGAVGRSLANGIGGAIAGTVRGVILGLKMGGLGLATATNGASLALGGGVGALGGIGSGISQSGDNVLLTEGNEIKVALQEPLELPGVALEDDSADQAVNLQGLKVDITDYALGRDPFKMETMIQLSFNINNQTDYRFGSFDMALADEYDNVFSPSPFGENASVLFNIPAHTQYQGGASFSVQSPDVKHFLIFYKPYTRDVVAKIPLSPAIRTLQQKQGESKNRKKASG